MKDRKDDPHARPYNNALPISAGQRAYEAWMRAHTGKNEVTITPWEKLSKYSKSVWESVARAARNGCPEHGGRKK